jgi:hypothetical protein
VRTAAPRQRDACRATAARERQWRGGGGVEAPDAGAGHAESPRSEGGTALAIWREGHGEHERVALRVAQLSLQRPAGQRPHPHAPCPPRLTSATAPPPRRARGRRTKVDARRARRDALRPEKTRPAGRGTDRRRTRRRGGRLRARSRARAPGRSAPAAAAPPAAPPSQIRHSPARSGRRRGTAHERAIRSWDGAGGGLATPSNAPRPRAERRHDHSTTCRSPAPVACAPPLRDATAPGRPAVSSKAGAAGRAHEPRGCRRERTRPRRCWPSALQRDTTRPRHFAGGAPRSR